MDIDLQPFCSTDIDRQYLLKPFSRNGYTYATNGHIMLRVAERPGIPDVEKQFNQERPLEGIEAAEFFRPIFDLPPAPDGLGPCDKCDGRGYAHDCPDCECECETCGGTSSVDPERFISTAVGPKSFALNYIRQVLALPDVEIQVFPAEDDGKQMLFRFRGGVGALMPLRGVKGEHVDIKLAPSPSAEGAGAKP